MAKLFSLDIPMWATAYIVADSAEEAQEVAKGLTNSMGEVPTGYFGDDIEIYGGQYHVDMPEVSLSPAMTVGDVTNSVDLVENFDEDTECGQCEGTGTIEGGLSGDGDDEECPVCDGSGELS